MAALNLTDRAQLLALVKAERKSFAESKNLSVPQKLDQNVTNLISSVAEFGAEIDDAELKDKLGAALEAGAGSHFVNIHRVMSDLKNWIDPMKPAPVEESDEGEGEEGGDEEA